MDALHEQDTGTPDPAAALLAEHCHLRIPSRPDWIGPTVDYLVQRAVRCGAVPASRESKLSLALHEALTNAVIHGNLGISSELKERGDDEFFRAVSERLADPAHARRVVDVQASHDSQAARWVLHDQGAGFDASSALARLDGPLDTLKPSGRGLLLIRAFTDEMHYEDGGRRLVLVVYRESDAERRVQPRCPMGGAVSVRELDGDGRPRAEERGAIARNVSAGGLAFLSSGDPPSGRIRLTIPGREGPMEVTAEVRHWHALEGNVIEVGCRFEAPLDSPTDAADNELGQLLERLAARPAGSERRSSPRMPFDGRVEVVLTGGQVLRGFGRDLSRSGVSFLCAGAPPLEAVQLRLSAGEGEPVVVQAVVVRATRLLAGLYDVGARFVPA